MTVRKWLLLLAVCSFAWGCGSDKPGTSPLPTPVTDPAALLTLVAGNPATYAGQQVTVEGVLESEGGMPSPAFFLADGRGGRLATNAWLPVEVIQPPEGGAQPRTMAFFVGKRLRLTGVVTLAGEVYQLQVAEAVEK